jgi:hypothetical protein
VGHSKGYAQGKVYSSGACINKTETSQINNLMMHHKCLEKPEQTKPQTIRQREIIKIRAEINDNKTKKTI